MNVVKTHGAYALQYAPTRFILRTVLFVPTIIILSIYYFRVLIYKCRIVRPKKLNAKVISVGNITLGGTGKTPLVLYLASELQKTGENIAILTRGYKRESKKQLDLWGGKSNLSWKEVGDEPYLLAQELPEVPVMVDKNRYKAGAFALRKYRSEFFLLDDGFQHWKLARDLDIVIIDSFDPFGGGKLFPAGYLREPVSSLKRADILLLNKSDCAINKENILDVLSRYNPCALVVESVYQVVSINSVLDDSSMEIESVKGKKALAFSGIANHISFEKTLESIGIKKLKHFKFSDHYPYQEKDLEKIENEAIDLGADLILTTEKDMFRIPPSGESRVPIYWVKIELKITQGEKELWDLIKKKIR
jgi:tetraacyldisaccharide 4'-kinase